MHPYIRKTVFVVQEKMFGLFGLSEKEKYDITGWAFSYFMTRHLTVSEAVEEAIKRVRPRKVARDGSIRLRRSVILELELRVKNML